MLGCTISKKSSDLTKNSPIRIDIFCRYFLTYLIDQPNSLNQLSESFSGYKQAIYIPPCNPLYVLGRNQKEKPAGPKDDSNSSLCHSYALVSNIYLHHVFLAISSEALQYALGGIYSLQTSPNNSKRTSNHTGQSRMAPKPDMVRFVQTRLD